MSVGGYISIYLAVYDPEITGGFGLEEKSQKTKAVCGSRKNKLWRFAECATPYNRPSNNLAALNQLRTTLSIWNGSDVLSACLGWEFRLCYGFVTALIETSNLMQNYLNYYNVFCKQFKS